MGLVDVVFFSTDSVAPGAVGIGVGYQRRLESNFVFRISAAITGVPSQPEGSGSGYPRPFDVDALGGQINTSHGYRFDTSQ